VVPSRLISGRLLIFFVGVMAEVPTISQEKTVESKKWWLGTGKAALHEHEGGLDKTARMKTVMRDAR
jgi:hypothetical protein